MGGFKLLNETLKSTGGTSVPREPRVGVLGRHRPLKTEIRLVPADKGTFVQFGESSPQGEPESEGATALALEGVWRVVVLNDPVNLMSYVVMVFKKVFGFDDATARRHMLEVHEQGRSVVWSGLREKAEAYAFTLQQWHLTAVLEPDEAH